MKSKRNGAAGKAGIGREIRKWRAMRGLLQKQLAHAAGMEVAQLCAIENDRNSPSVKTVARIAAALRISTAQLFAAPGRGDGRPADAPQAKPLRAQSFEATPIMRLPGREKLLSKIDAARMEKAIVAAAEAEAAQQIDIPTSLPVAFPVIVNEGGAEQLSHFLRAHLDIGSAVVRDVQHLFEDHGIRILHDASLTDKKPSITFHSPARRDFTVFLTNAFEKKPWRRDFLLLTEIGRIFVFASKNFETFTETDRSRRFAHHFAATFLQPAAAVRTTVYSLRVKPGDWTFELLLRLKKRFGVSAQAFNIRLKELGLITTAKHEEFKRRIGELCKAPDFTEPMPDAGLPENRRGDLEALLP